jgi:hypothetical protein|tara:strand:+ start:287 stop:649 length:363 start_codon:yes stop_codon:yes gene_type:complete
MMMSFGEYLLNEGSFSSALDKDGVFNWSKFFDYRKTTGTITGKGGRGGSTESDEGGFRAMIVWRDPKNGNRKTHSLIPPVQYKAAKNKRELKKIVELWTSEWLYGSMNVKDTESIEYRKQ